MHPLLAVLAVVIVIALIIVIYKFINTRGVHGLPVPDLVDCSAGTVSGHFNPGNSDTPDNYYARIINVSTDPATIPQSTWQLWAAATATTSSSSAGLTFSLTGVGRDEPSSNVRVAVWCTFGTDPKVGHADMTCGGSGNAAILLNQAASNGPTRVTDTVSMRYSVDLSGFGPELVAGIARACQLIYRGGVQGVLWDNGEDGSERLRVELVADRLYDADWRLTFRFRDIVISYAKSAHEWQSLGINIFHAVVQPSGAQVRFPESVRLIPA